ncbi:MAG: hypothetical protein GY925_23625 [Actinomycetia bacterium]|nr:hypothetical protein [Actinomycetes bacterium]
MRRVAPALEVAAVLAVAFVALATSVAAQDSDVGESNAPLCAFVAGTQAFADPYAGCTDPMSGSYVRDYGSPSVAEDNLESQIHPGDIRGTECTTVADCRGLWKAELLIERFAGGAIGDESLVYSWKHQYSGVPSSSVVFRRDRFVVVTGDPGHDGPVVLLAGSESMERAQEIDQQIVSYLADPEAEISDLPSHESGDQGASDTAGTGAENSQGEADSDDETISDEEAIAASITGAFIALIIAGLTLAEAGQVLTEVFGVAGRDFAEGMGAFDSEAPVNERRPAAAPAGMPPMGEVEWFPEPAPGPVGGGGADPEWFSEPAGGPAAGGDPAPVAESPPWGSQPTDPLGESVAPTSPAQPADGSPGALEDDPVVSPIPDPPVDATDEVVGAPVAGAGEPPNASDASTLGPPTDDPFGDSLMDLIEDAPTGSGAPPLESDGGFTGVGPRTRLTDTDGDGVHDMLEVDTDGDGTFDERTDLGAIARERAAASGVEARPTAGAEPPPSEPVAVEPEAEPGVVDEADPIPESDMAEVGGDPDGLVEADGDEPGVDQPPVGPLGVDVSEAEIEDIYRRGLASGRSLEDLREDVAGLSQARGGTGEFEDPFGLEMADTEAGPAPLTAAELADYRATQQHLAYLEARRGNLDDSWHDLQTERAAARQAEAVPFRAAGAAFEAWENMHAWNEAIATEEEWIYAYNEWMRGNRWRTAPDGSTYTEMFETDGQAYNAIDQHRQRINELEEERRQIMLDLHNQPGSTDDFARIDRKQDEILARRRNLDHEIDTARAAVERVHSYTAGRPLPQS